MLITQVTGLNKYRKAVVRQINADVFRVIPEMVFLFTLLIFLHFPLVTECQPSLLQQLVLQLTVS